MERPPTRPGRLPRIRTFEAWHTYRDFRFLWLANYCANSARWLQLLTVGWLVRDLTVGRAFSPLLVITVGGLYALPVLFVGPWGGVLGDRVDRRKLIMVTQGLMSTFAALFALLVSTGHHEVWHIYVYVFIGGVANSITHPMQQALIANTVSREHLTNAYATNTLTITSTRLIGPFVGGILIAALGFVWNFALESALYVLLVMFLMATRTPYGNRATTTTQASPLADLKEGVRYIWRGERVIFDLTMLQLVPNVLLQPLIFLLPTFTSEVLHKGADFGGYLMATTGFAGLVSTLVIASGGFNRKRGIVCLATVAVSSVFTILFARSEWLVASFILLGLFSYSQSTFRTSTGTLIQLLSPDRLRGRISSLQRYVEGFLPLTSMLIGVLAWNTSAPFAMTLVGFVGVGLSILSMRTNKRLRELE